MIPPTPTPLPPGAAHFTLPESYSIWASTNWAIQTWNLLSYGQYIIQALILIAIVIAGIAVFRRFMAEFMQKDTQE